MPKAQNTAAAPAGAKRKLTRAEKKEIAAIIQRAKGDGKPHTAQQTIPYIQMYPDGICHVSDKRYSKSIAFEDINYQLAQADDKTANERTVDRCPLAHGTKRPADVREAIEQRDQANLQDTDIHKFSLLISILGFTAKAVPPLVSELRERSSGVGPAVYFNSFLTSSFASDGTIWQ